MRGWASGMPFQGYTPPPPRFCAPIRWVLRTQSQTSGRCKGSRRQCWLHNAILNCRQMHNAVPCVCNPLVPHKVKVNCPGVTVPHGWKSDMGCVGAQPCATLHDQPTGRTITRNPVDSTPFSRLCFALATPRKMSASASADPENQCPSLTMLDSKRGVLMTGNYQLQVLEQQKEGLAGLNGPLLY